MISINKSWEQFTRIRIRQILYLLYQHNKITENLLQQNDQVIIIMEENMIVRRDFLF